MILADAHFSRDTPHIFGLDLPVACFPPAREPGFTPSNRRAPQVCRKAPKIDRGDRLLWICLSRLWRDWRSALAIVKPETVVAWHRAAFRLFWTWKVRCGQPGRPVLSSEVRDLIRKMCRRSSSRPSPAWKGTGRLPGTDSGTFNTNRMPGAHS